MGGRPSDDPAHRAVLADGIRRETRAFRGLTHDRALGYLENLGGTVREDGHVEGNGWLARQHSRRVPVGPAYRLTEVTITWEGDPAAVRPVLTRLRTTAFRAPG
ncbi:MAG: hypothetical protein ACLFMX_02195 [Halobacteriales archaeon]